MKSKNGDEPLAEDPAFQFTPGGRRARKNVHMVASGGTSSSGAAALITSPSARRKPNNTKGIPSLGEFVTPPGGRRHRSRVRRIRSGENFLFSQSLGSRLRAIDRPGPPDAANWITCAGWINDTGSAITQFSTTWTVPPPPTAAGTQLIYLFNGIEPADGKTIVQPVLQWGDSGADPDGQNRTGPFWTAASWLVGGADDSATHTPHVRVNPGDVLVGLIQLVGRTATGFSYTCEFQGLAGTTLPTPEIDELVWCVHTLEAYELQGNQNPPYDLGTIAEYPGTASIPFGSINIITNAPSPNGSWAAHNIAATLGETTTIDVDASTDGQVTVHL